MGCNQIFLDRKPLKDLPSLGAMGKPHTHDLFRSCTGYVLAFEMDRAGGGPCDARNGVEERRLASAVRAEDDDDFPLIDLQIDAFKNADAPVS